MLMRAFENSRMPFRKRIQLRLLCSILIILCGIGIFIFTMMKVLGANDIHDFVQGFYTGIAGGFFGAGVATACQCIRYLRDEQRLKAQELKETDERNVFVAARAAQLAFYFVIGIVLIAVFVTGLIPAALPVFVALLAVLAMMFLAWLITYIVCNKLY